ncbi:hypothetical protein K8M07_01595 [Schnuerera sp. xch1]|uniref:HlyD family efflux transporter periplasmic adaptor subunit n=1 Tax=Schnuerera sp. xch1 TaxID=2874283 RepID=UPI001CBEA695|nr:HlyD family efflux transporter periplasmic adaptor subunit [Schnuerera sp. xch1]MBZ2173948.1 hypothetical protein [Schnuerera sp. xch1]
MSQEQRMKKRKKKRRIRLYIIAFVFVYLIFRSVPSLFAAGSKTKTPERSAVEDKISTEAIIVRKEYVYEADGQGKVKLLQKEGERIPVGTKIAELTLLDNTSTLKQKLTELDDKIATLTKTEAENKPIKNDKKKVEENIDNIINDIQLNISQGDYEQAEILKDKLSIYSDKKGDISNDNNLINQSLDSLRKQREQIVNQINNHFVNYFAKESGIVSYKIDGYEDVYSFNNIEECRYSDFKEQTNKQKIISNNDKVKSSEPIFKVINNFEWYMIIKIEDVKDIDTYEEADSIFLTGKDIDGELKGRIKKINVDNGKGLIVCKFDRDFEYYYDKRHIDVDIVKYRYDGYKISSESVVELNGVKGVYIKDISGIIKFRPIKILKEDDEFTYISIGDKNNNINIEGKDKPVRTVAQFDEILLNTKKAEEGMLVD